MLAAREAAGGELLQHLGLAGESRDLGNHKGGGFEGQGEGGLGDAAGPPRGEVTAQRPAPQVRGSRYFSSTAVAR
jgi:hypothetical protein